MAGMKIYCRHCHTFHTLFPSELAEIIRHYQDGDGMAMTTKGIEFDCILFVREENKESIEA